MSSRFVSGGTISTALGKSGSEIPSSAPAEAKAAEPSAASSTAPGSTEKSSRSAEWEAAQKNLEAERQRREEQRRKAATGEEKSLYEILQENKGNVSRLISSRLPSSMSGRGKRRNAEM
jgi:hypothetical protein